MRAVRIANLIIKPFDYNPVTKIIKIYKKLKFIIHYDNADIPLTNKIKQKYSSPFFESNYNQIHNSFILPFSISDFICYLISSIYI